jgi:hypothetical protein
MRIEPNSIGRSLRQVRHDEAGLSFIIIISEKSDQNFITISRRRHRCQREDRKRLQSQLAESYPYEATVEI